MVNRVFNTNYGQIVVNSIYAHVITQKNYHFMAAGFNGFEMTVVLFKTDIFTKKFKGFSYK